MDKERWIFLFFVSYVLLNWPFLSIFKTKPFLYLFSVWAVIIALIFIFTYSIPTKDRDRSGPEEKGG